MSAQVLSPILRSVLPRIAGALGSAASTVNRGLSTAGRGALSASVGAGRLGLSLGSEAAKGTAKVLGPYRPYLLRSMSEARQAGHAPLTGSRYLKELAGQTSETTASKVLDKAFGSVAGSGTGAVGGWLAAPEDRKLEGALGGAALGALPGYRYGRHLRGAATFASTPVFDPLLSRVSPTLGAATRWGTRALTVAPLGLAASTAVQMPGQIAESAAQEFIPNPDKGIGRRAFQKTPEFIGRLLFDKDPVSKTLRQTALQYAPKYMGIEIDNTYWHRPKLMNSVDLVGSSTLAGILRSQIVKRLRDPSGVHIPNTEFNLAAKKNLVPAMVSDPRSITGSPMTKLLADVFFKDRTSREQLADELSNIQNEKLKNVTPGLTKGFVERTYNDLSLGRGEETAKLINKLYNDNLSNKSTREQIGNSIVDGLIGERNPKWREHGERFNKAFKPEDFELTREYYKNHSELYRKIMDERWERHRERGLPTNREDIMKLWMQAIQKSEEEAASRIDPELRSKALPIINRMNSFKQVEPPSVVYPNRPMILNYLLRNK